jgi:hypothetical protein
LASFDCFENDEKIYFCKWADLKFSSMFLDVKVVLR